MGMWMEKLKLLNNFYSVLHPYASRSNEPAIADTGASGHYLKGDAQYDTAIRLVALIQGKQPNGQILQYTKGCRLELATLTEEEREAHILLGLAHRSLISIGELCDSGREASFNKHTMAVTKDKHVVLQGTKDAITGLWRVHLQSLDRPTHQSNNLHQVNGKEDYIKYLHASTRQMVNTHQ